MVAEDTPGKRPVVGSRNRHARPDLEAFGHDLRVGVAVGHWRDGGGRRPAALPVSERTRSSNAANRSANRARSSSPPASDTLHRDKLLRPETRVFTEQSRQAAQQQPRTRQEHQRKRDLCCHQCSPQSPVTSWRGGGPLFQALMQVHPRRRERRRCSKDQCRQYSSHCRKGEDHPVGSRSSRGAIEAGAIEASAARSSLDSSSPSSVPHTPSSTHSVSICRHQRAPACAQCQTHRELASSRHRTRQHHVGDVDARQQ